MRESEERIVLHERDVMLKQIESLQQENENLQTQVAQCKEVQEFAKAKADGRLVVLPCKVGDTVYAVQGVEIIQCKVTEVTISESGISYIRLFSTDDRLADFRHEHFKRTVFLTREAAEKAIAEVGE